LIIAIEIVHVDAKPFLGAELYRRKFTILVYFN